MKTIKSILLCLTLLNAQLSFGKTTQVKPKKPKNPPAVEAPSKPTDKTTALLLNPETIREQLLASNLTIQEELQNVYKAKDQLNIARADLLPSLNLGALLSVNAGTFALSSIEFLLPFLVPPNWFQLDVEKNTFESEKLSYKIVKLNSYSSALSIYYTMIADQELQTAYKNAYTALEKIYEYQNSLVPYGRVDKVTLDQTSGQMDAAASTAARMGEMVAQELSFLRLALGIPLEVNLSIEPGDMPASAAEGQDVQAMVDQAIAISPEYQQYNYLIAAAKAQRLEATFSWLTGFDLASNSSGSGNASISHLNAAGSLNFSFAIFPQISYASHNIDQVKLEQQSVVQSDTQLLESAIKSVVYSNSAYNFAKSAEDANQEAYKFEVDNYPYGHETEVDILTAENNAINSSVARIQANLDLNLLRVNLHRTLLTSEFANIEGCSANVQPPGKHGGGLFKKAKVDQVSLDQLCKRAPDNAQSAAVVTATPDDKAAPTAPSATEPKADDKKDEGTQAPDDTNVG